MVAMRGCNLTGGENLYSKWQAAGVPKQGTDYLFVSNRDIDYELSKGANSFRLVFGWESMQPSPLKIIAGSAYFAQFKAVVDYATGKGASVTIDVHGGDAGISGGAYHGVKIPGSYGGHPVADGLVDLWRQLAGVFKGNPLVFFGLMNEPNGVPIPAWFACVQKIVDAVRAAGATNKIVAPGAEWTGASTWVSSGNAAAWNLTDPANNLAFQVHLYADANAGGDADDVVSKTILADRLKGAIAWARTKGLQLVVGEVGVQPANALAAAAWASLVALMEANADVVLGWYWWAHGPEIWWSGWRYTLCPTGNFANDSPSMKLIAHDLASVATPPSPPPSPVPVPDPQIAALQAQVASLTAQLAKATADLSQASWDLAALRLQAMTARDALSAALA